MQEKLKQSREYWEELETSRDALEASGWVVRGEGLSPEVQDRVVKDIIEKLRLTGSDKLLDAGCGSMIYFNRLKGMVTSAVGMDFSFQTLNSFRDANLVTCGELGRIPFKDNKFTKVLCNGVLVCLPDQSYVKKTILELIRICMPGGLILLSDILNGMLEKEQKKSRYNRANLFYYLRHPYLFFKRFFLSSQKQNLLSVHPLFIKKIVEENGHKCILLLNAIEGKAGSEWRYDVLIEKKDVSSEI